jgi:hypothetical protein
VEMRKQRRQGRPEPDECPNEPITTPRTRFPEEGGHDAQPLSPSTGRQPPDIQAFCTSIESPRTLPEHVISHQIPHWPFLVHLTKGDSAGQKNTLQPEQHAHADVNTDTFIGTSAIGLEDLLFLKKKRVFDLPKNDSMDKVLSAYFTIIHPFFPILDKPLFLRLYDGIAIDQILSGHGPSLLLLYAVLFSGLSVISTLTFCASAR